jgi:hypothetical protein
MPAINLNHESVVARNLRKSVRSYEEVFGMQRVPTPNFGFPVQWPDATWEQELGQAMFQLNIDAVHDRYGAGEAAAFRDLTYTYPPAHGSEIQVLKSLWCWLYQCDEGQVGQQPVYRFFNDVVEQYLMSKIIHALPEYEQATWGYGWGQAASSHACEEGVSRV